MAQTEVYHLKRQKSACFRSSDRGERLPSWRGASNLVERLFCARDKMNRGWEWLRRHNKVVQDVFIVLLCVLFLSTQLGRKEVVMKNPEHCMVSQPAGAESPLKDMVESYDYPLLSEVEQGLIEEINQLCDLELQTLVIAETVVPVGEYKKLITSVERQLATSIEVLGREQATAVLEMLRLLPSESGLLKETAGEQGSLTSYSSLAVVKQQDSNLHFLLTAMKAEPHLRLRRISWSKRNAWKSALSKFLTQRVIIEVKRRLLHQDN